MNNVSRLCLFSRRFFVTKVGGDKKFVGAPPVTADRTRSEECYDNWNASRR